MATERLSSRGMLLEREQALREQQAQQSLFEAQQAEQAEQERKDQETLDQLNAYIRTYDETYGIPKENIEDINKIPPNIQNADTDTRNRWVYQVRNTRLQLERYKAALERGEISGVTAQEIIADANQYGQNYSYYLIQGEHQSRSESRRESRIEKAKSAYEKNPSQENLNKLNFYTRQAGYEYPAKEEQKAGVRVVPNTPPPRRDFELSPIIAYRKDTGEIDVAESERITRAQRGETAAAPPSSALITPERQAPPSFNVISASSSLYYIPYDYREDMTFKEKAVSVVKSYPSAFISSAQELFGVGKKGYPDPIGALETFYSPFNVFSSTKTRGEITYTPADRQTASFDPSTQRFYAPSVSVREAIGQRYIYNIKEITTSEETASRELTRSIETELSPKYIEKAQARQAYYQERIDTGALTLEEAKGFYETELTDLNKGYQQEFSTQYETRYKAEVEPSLTIREQYAREMYGSYAKVNPEVSTYLTTGTLIGSSFAGAEISYLGSAAIAVSGESQFLKGVSERSPKDILIGSALFTLGSSNLIRTAGREVTKARIEVITEQQRAVREVRYPINERQYIGVYGAEANVQGVGSLKQFGTNLYTQTGTKTFSIEGSSISEIRVRDFLSPTDEFISLGSVSKVYGTGTILESGQLFPSGTLGITSERATPSLFNIRTEQVYSYQYRGGTFTKAYTGGKIKDLGYFGGETIPSEYEQTLLGSRSGALTKEKLTQLSTKDYETISLVQGRYNVQNIGKIKVTQYSPTEIEYLEQTQARTFNLGDSLKSVYGGLTPAAPSPEMELTSAPSLISKSSSVAPSLSAAEITSFAQPSVYNIPIQEEYLGTLQRQASRSRTSEFNLARSSLKIGSATSLRERQASLSELKQSELSLGKIASSSLSGQAELLGTKELNLNEQLTEGITSQGFTGRPSVSPPFGGFGFILVEPPDFPKLRGGEPYGYERPKKRKFRYTPTLAGVISGKTISKGLGGEFSGAEIRYPERRRSIRRSKRSSRIRKSRRSSNEFSMPSFSKFKLGKLKI